MKPKVSRVLFEYSSRFVVGTDELWSTGSFNRQCRVEKIELASLSFAVGFCFQCCGAGAHVGCSGMCGRYGVWMECVCTVVGEVDVLALFSCGVSVFAEMWYLRWVGTFMCLASLQVSFLSAKIVPADRRFVAGYSFVEV